MKKKSRKFKELGEMKNKKATTIKTIQHLNSGRNRKGELPY
jgi:hypothetical protein